MIGKAKEALSSEETRNDLINKAKDAATDERIDSAAGAVKEHTPDKVDGIVDSVASKAKDLNND
ncbi:MAG TPA: hypothetical protein IAA98_11835 [Candidatus Avipropionibacterium avicola]|uniref:MT0933-like antitoxin protein n=1 Tax=Candidatus Avipropionibacterium avicola TaxID=2840701 RepID=A0A9D1GZ84_9ACTN|nr:hypothetical protein [Candidatus Avipropionibacterium avicola]